MKSKNNLVSQYLIHSYLYYLCNRPVIDDSAFDKICHDLLVNWDSITHMHKHLLTVEDLKAGTGYTLKMTDYPEIVKSVASTILLHGENYYD